MTRTGKMILIADHDRGRGEMLAAQCRDIGLTVETAFNAAAALTQFTFGQPDLVCLDGRLKCGSGDLLCERIVADCLRTSIPLIAMMEAGQSDGQLLVDDARTYIVDAPSDPWDAVQALIQELLNVDAQSNGVETSSSEVGEPSLVGG
ncbi:MAG: response regulator [Pirellulaceae bacterium]|jgi:CheY-like chemotaxis protein|nr:response regulator [Pirellulaceae bacterium]MDP7018635.1 response regulator [Pirellulaceae bacterium]